MKKSKSMTKAEAIFLLVAGLFMGTVFTFLVQYANAPVSREESRHITAVFSSYGTQRERGRVKEIIVRFADHDQLYIDGSCISDALLDSVEILSPGTELTMIVHPNSNTILDLRVGKLVLLEFEAASNKLAKEAKGFLGLGLFCYVLSACGLCRLVFGKRR